MDEWWIDYDHWPGPDDKWFDLDEIPAWVGLDPSSNDDVLLTRVMFDKPIILESGDALSFTITESWT